MVNAEIIGISFDTIEENKAFAIENDFPYKLLSDPDRKVGEAYQAKREPDHKWTDFPRRLTYLIDPDGKIAKAYHVKDVQGHADQVLADLEQFRRRGG